MQRHCENGEKVAHFLNDHPLIDTVYWPGLKSHINHDVAKNQMNDFGGMISFNLVGDDLEISKECSKQNRIVYISRIFRRCRIAYWPSFNNDTCINSKRGKN